MTLDKAKELATEWSESFDRNNTASAFRVLLDALRAAESQVAKMQSGGAEAMREAAAKVADKQADLAKRDRAFSAESDLRIVADLIRALPVPPARTSEPAAPTMVTKPLDVRHWPAPPGAKWTATVTYPEPGVTMGPGEPAAPTPGPTTPDAPFDAEAALETALLVIRDRYPRAGSVVESIHVITMLDEALAAGRRGTR